MLQKRSIIITLLLFAGLCVNAHAAIVSGVVYQDNNNNQKRDPGEKGISGVLVSNQHDVVTTDRKGRYTIEAGSQTILFITKPSGYMTPLNDKGLPQFYYIHYEKSSPKLHYGGIETTGPLPASVDFPLVKVKEPKKFSFFALGDPQPRNCTEITYMKDDVLPELLEAPGKFAIALGDIAFDDLSVYDCYQEAMAKLGIPIYNVPGNHDMNFDAVDDQYAMETFRRTYGPEYYSFDYGQAHFVVLDDIEHKGKNKEGRYYYHEKIDPEQIEWLKNDLALVPENKLVVLTMHAPLLTYHTSNGIQNLKDLNKVLEDRDRVLALAGHTHTCEQHFIGEEYGRTNPDPVHVIVCGAMCGSWWMGPKDERGIPIADQRDGTHNGWYLIEVDGTDYRFQYKAAGKDKDYQLRISSPDAPVAQDSLGKEQVVVNVFAGSEKTEVICRIDNRPAVMMTQTKMKDPYFEMLAAMPDEPFNWARPTTTGHIWTTPLPENLEPGLHNVVVEVLDLEGKSFQTSKIIRVE